MSNSIPSSKSLHASIILQKVGRPVAYYPSIARVLGSVKSAVFLCQFLYWEGKQKDKEGWIYKTAGEINEETGLSRNEQEGARKRLRDLGILKEKKKGIPAMIYFLFDWGKFDEIFEKHLNPVTVQTRLAKSDNLDCHKTPNLIGEKCQSIPETTDIEDDAEITTEREEERGPGLSLSSDFVSHSGKKPLEEKDEEGKTSFSLPGKDEGDQKDRRGKSPGLAGAGMPTAKQISYARSLSAEHGIPLPEGIETSIEICSLFISQVRAGENRMISDGRGNSYPLAYIIQKYRCSEKTASMWARTETEEIEEKSGQITLSQQGQGDDIFFAHDAINTGKEEHIK